MRVEGYELWKDYQLISNNWKQHYTKWCKISRVKIRTCINMH